MEKAYLITTHNPEAEFIALKAKRDVEKPLAFLSKITVGLTKTGNPKSADNMIAFDITPRLEFMICDDSVIDSIYNVITDFGFNVTIKDAIKDLLEDKIDLTNASEFTKYCIDEYYVNNFDGDDILDKITNNTKGIEGLNELDKKILKMN